MSTESRPQPARPLPTRSQPTVSATTAVLFWTHRRGGDAHCLVRVVTARPAGAHSVDGTPGLSVTVVASELHDNARGHEIDADFAGLDLPQVITPVPGGGIGPIEMATLSERLTIAQAAPELASWRYLDPDHHRDPARAEPAQPARLTSAHDDVEQQLTATREEHPGPHQLDERDRHEQEPEPQ